MSTDFRIVSALVACWLVPVSGASAGTVVNGGFPNSQKQSLLDTASASAPASTDAPPPPAPAAPSAKAPEVPDIADASAGPESARAAAKPAPEAPAAAPHAAPADSAAKPVRAAPAVKQEAAVPAAVPVEAAVTKTPAPHPQAETAAAPARAPEAPVLAARSPEHRTSRTPRMDGTFPSRPVVAKVLDRFFVWCARLGAYSVDVVCFWDENGPDTDLYGRRRAAIPEVGLVPQRFTKESSFDRRKIFGLADYARMQAEARAAEQARAAEKPAPATAAPVAAAPDRPGISPRTIVAARPEPDSTIPGPGREVSATSSQTVQIDPASLLRYFDERNSPDDVRVGVRFLMPYQSEPPLKMESGAAYTEGGDSGSNK